MENWKFLAKTKNGYDVYVDTVRSHAATHLDDIDNLENLVVEFLEATEISGDDVALERDMGRVIGTMDLVETDDTDEIIYAKRMNRATYTRFVKDRKPSPTRYLTVILRKRGDGYELWSAWTGRLVPSFPGDERETPESREFWSHHALIWGNQAVDQSTITTTQPW